MELLTKVRNQLNLSPTRSWAYIEDIDGHTLGFKLRLDIAEFSTEFTQSADSLAIGDDYKLEVQGPGWDNKFEIGTWAKDTYLKISDLPFGISMILQKLPTTWIRPKFCDVQVKQWNNGKYYVALDLLLEKIEEDDVNPTPPSTFRGLL